MANESDAEYDFTTGNMWPLRNCQQSGLVGGNNTGAYLRRGECLPCASALSDPSGKREEFLRLMEELEQYMSEHVSANVKRTSLFFALLRKK